MSKLIPDALRTAVLPTVETMEIQTQIIEPLVASKTFCRFQLDRIGILDSGSAIQIGIVAPLQSDDAKVYQLKLASIRPLSAPFFVLERRL